MSGFWVWGVRVLCVGCQGPFGVQGVGFRDEEMFEGFWLTKRAVITVLKFVSLLLLPSSHCEAVKLNAPHKLKRRLPSKCKP